MITSSVLIAQETCSLDKLTNKVLKFNSLMQLFQGTGRKKHCNDVIKSIWQNCYVLTIKAGRTLQIMPVCNIRRIP